jgi:hypothetical protein
VALRLARVRDEKTHDGDRRLVAVLLEEHPLQHLRPVVRVLGDEARPLCEVPEDRAGLRERATVVQHESRNAEVRVEAPEYLPAVRAIDDVEVPALVLEAEVREEQAHLVAVARDR